MTDPEGSSSASFVREGEITQRLYEIGIDTADSPEAAHRIAAWWADVLGARVTDDDSGYSYIDEGPGRALRLPRLLPRPRSRRR